jgi:two-component system, chemotaxis family, response regulator Rcp1
MSPVLGERHRPLEVLLVEDNPGDVRLTQEVLKETRVATRLSVARDGEEALAFLRRERCFADAPRPDLILLDLNLPRKDGRELLADIKFDPQFRRIPVLVLTTSRAEQDVTRVYDLQANCYIVKPGSLDEFVAVVKAIEAFWMTWVALPEGG